MGKLTAVVISKNEESVIGRALKSLSFADEIVVVDGESTDRTPEIAKEYGAKVVTQPWLGFAEQRNISIKKEACYLQHFIG